MLICGATNIAPEAWRGARIDTAAKALGVSRRMVAYYDKGEKPIPRTVALATKALEMGD
jgi:predicted transcriptional regulator